MAGKLSVGLDIGASGIKLAVVSRDGAGHQIHQLEHVPLPPGMVKLGFVSDPKDEEQIQELTQYIRSMVHNLKLPSTSVVIGLSDPASIRVSTISVPWVQPDLMAKTLGAQLRRNRITQLEDDEYQAEWRVLATERTSDGGAELKLSVTTSQTEQAERVTDVVMEAGLKIASVRSAALATIWANPAYRRASRDPDRIAVIVDIGASQSTVVAHQNGIPLYVRTNPIGGLSVSEELMDSLGYSTMAEAERDKCHAQPDAMVAERLIAPVTKSAEFVRSSISDFLTNVAPTCGLEITGIGSITMTGGGCRLYGLPEAVRDVAESINPDGRPAGLHMGAYLGADADHEGPDFTVAVGLAASVLPAVRVAHGSKAARKDAAA